MKLISVINKSFKEQIRNFWIFILTISMAPFFVFVYYLIIETSKPHYEILLINQDKGIAYQNQKLNHGDDLLEFTKTVDKDTFNIPLTVNIIESRSDAILKLKNRKADALVIIPEDFSEYLQNVIVWDSNKNINIEFIGDLTNVKYMISAIWANEMLNEFVFQVVQKPRLIEIKETGLGLSGHIDDFDLIVPGILILSIIMLMFTATVAIVDEVENKTIVRLKLSQVSTFEFLSGISIVQIGVGLISILLTYIVAVWLGFDYVGSFGIIILIAILTSISIIAFSLIIAAITKTVNEVMIVGNFPLFLFMFFTGAAFPLKGTALFTIAGYPISLQGFMSPTHSISALNKVLVMNMELNDIIPEITVLIILTILYFFIGVWAFKKRHMKIL